MTRSTVKKLTEPLDKPKREFQRLRRVALRQHQNESLAIAGRNLFNDDASNVDKDDDITLEDEGEVTNEASEEESLQRKWLLNNGLETPFSLNLDEKWSPAAYLITSRESIHIPLTWTPFMENLNSRELKKRTEGIKKETGDGLYVRGKSDHSGKAHSGGSSRFKSRGGTSKLKCFICHSKGHLKRDCPKKKSSGFVKKGKHDQDSDSFDDKGNTYFGETLVVVENDEMTELVMDSGGSYHMTHRRDFLYDFKGFDDGSVQLGDNRTCTIKWTRKVKIQLHDGSSFILEHVRYVPALRRSLISLDTLEKEGYTVKMKG
ncbi:zinc finger, CCHC-type containing protein [Tanacetum coccineum]